MKKYLRKTATVLACVMMLGSSACGGGQDSQNSGASDESSQPHVCSFTEQVVNDAYKKSDATCVQGATYYYSCQCGESGAETFLYGNALGHSGGSATCNEKAVCQACGVEYGELLAHDYATDWQTDDGGHWHACQTSGCTATSGRETHYGGEATETERAVCEICGVPYGGFAGHEHKYTQQTVADGYKKSDATCEEKAVYYYACTCGLAGEDVYEYGDFAACADNNSDHNCDVCETPLTTHTGGTATTKKRAVCDICGEEYGDFKFGVIMDTPIPSGTMYQLGDSIYDFEITDSDGVTHKLSETLKTKKLVVLNFWADWCSPCRAEFPVMNTAYNEYKDDVEIFAISTYNTTEEVIDFKAKNGLLFPMFSVSGGGGLDDYFDFNGIPTTVMIDRYGNVAYQDSGSITSLSTWRNLFRWYIADDYEPVDWSV